MGDQWDKSLTDLAVEAGLKSIEDSRVGDPDQIIIGNMFSAASSSQEHLGALVANGLGLVGKPALKVESACASGGAAVGIGRSLIKSGEANSVLVVGVEKMRDLEAGEITEALCMAENAEYTQFFGVSFAALNAMLANLYMHQFDVSRDQLSAIPVISHANASTAPHAQFRKPITREDVARSPLVSDPLRLLDCAPIGDGAASVMLASEELIAQTDGSKVELLGSALATNHFSIYERGDMLEFAATKNAFKKALDAARVSRGDIDFLEIHDAFSVVAALTLEAMGFSRRGEGAADADRGKYSIHGEFPINTFGGLKGRGHPVGATGVYQVAEAYLQLKGVAGKNQVRDAKIGLAHNVGGIDTSATVHVLGRLED